MKDKALVAELNNGSVGALEEIVGIYSGYVRTVARNFSRGALTAEDIDELVSDVFYRLWTRRESIDGDIGLRPYLSVAVKNAVKNRFKGAHAAAESLDGLDIASRISVENAAELSDIMRHLHSGLYELSDGEREAFFRFYFYGESAAQTAALIGTTEDAVYKKLQRARDKLRSYLKKRGYEHV